MTTKRKIIGRLVPCRCFRGEEEVISVLDYSHCSLQQVPKEIFSFERTLEELYLDANQIEELPKQLFNCQALRKLSIPDNDLSNLPTTIASLVNLRELDISKNGIQEFPDNIKCCKCLSVVEASVNPIAKLPEGFTQLLNLTQLFLNDAFLEYLPANFGSPPALVLDTDVMCACFVFQPEVLEQIHNLKELWMDNNSLQTIPGCIGKLRHLRYLDLAKNRIESLDTDISGCESLEDLLLSSNMLQHLPDTIGMLKKLTTLKVDDNQLTSLPNTIGSLSLLEEFDCSCNELESLPPTIGYLHNLRTFSADENFLVELPREIGNCKNVTVMSLRSNKLEFLPDEIGQMTKLHVLNLSDNRLKNLPFTFTKLKDLAALWLSDNQSKALIPLQTEAHPETKQRVLTNYMFPQQPRHDEDYQSDSDSFNPTLWEEQRQQRMTVAFEFEEKKEEEDNSGKVEINLKRYPTPYPEDLKNMVKSVQNMVGKNQHPLSTNCSGTNMESRKQEQYEPPWPMPPKEVTVGKVLKKLCVCVCFYVSVFCVITHFSSQDSMGGSPNDIRISDMRPTLVEPPMYKPKVVLLGKDKKGRPQTFVAGILIQYKHNQYHLRICNNCPLFPYLNALPGTFPSTGTWGYLDSRSSGQGRSSQQANMYQHVQSKPTRPSSGAMVMSKSSERLSPMMKEVKAKFKKSQSIDEIDMGSYNVYSIPVDTYSSSIENQGSVDRPDMPGPMEQSMSRSQSAPMLDDDDAYGANSQQQKPSIPKKVYHFDQSFNPQGAMDLRNQQQERRAPPPFPNTPEYINHPGKTLPKELVSPRGYRGYPPMDQMFSYSQPSVNEENQPPQQQQPFPIPSQRSRPGFLRRADSLVSSTELALFRRVQEAQEMQQKSDHYGRQHFKGMLEHQNSLASMAQQDQQYNKRNGRYEEDYSSYQEPKKPIMGYPTKSLTQRRPLSARSYSTETFGASQARPVSARPTMAALLEKMPPDYNLSTCTENIKSPDEMKMRTMQLQHKPEDMSSKMPVDWRQQLLRHIEAKRLDRVSLTTSFSLWEYTVASSLLHDCTPSTCEKNLADDPCRKGSVRDQNVYAYAQQCSIILEQWLSYFQILIEMEDAFVEPYTIPNVYFWHDVVFVFWQFCVRIEKNPGLGFSISGGISGQGNPFKPSDMGIFVTRVQPDGPASNLLQPGDKILKANGHSFLHMEHETAVSLLKNFQKTVDLVILRESTI
uniref:Leucine-rich repeat-containing protein 7 n=1 Tax=Oncorhynchus kisutch TaxID=8019 RepID=A0A8C7KK25_ONCKI